MEIILNENTYTLTSVKSKALRQALELTQGVDFNNLTPATLDTLVSFICDTFGNKFSIDDVYNGLEAKDLLPTITKTIQFITGSFSKEVEKIPNE